MKETRDRLLVVPAGVLDELLELASAAASRLGAEPALADALRGATAAARAEIVVEPS